MTVGSLADLGYAVDFNAAEAYKLPNHLALAEGAIVESREGKYAWITDDRGLHVQVAADALVPLA